MNKEQVSELMKSLEPPCNCYECVGECHLVRIGDVLETPEIVIAIDDEERSEKIYEIWGLWYEFGTNKSLQEIVEEVGWEKLLIKHRRQQDGTEEPSEWGEQLKDPNARALFNFLNDIFNE